MGTPEKKTFSLSLKKHFLYAQVGAVGKKSPSTLLLEIVNMQHISLFNYSYLHCVRWVHTLYVHQQWNVHLGNRQYL